MKPRRAPWLLALLPLTALAGHGLLNSFSDLQWLPAPGRTPDQWDYWLDGWREHSALLLAHDDNERIGLCLDYMRDKLAEAEAMVGKADRRAAAIAVANYRDYLERAQALVDGSSSPGARLDLARALLEHQYMVSVDYVDLPLTPRALLAALMNVLEQRYTELRKQLPPAQAQALFFKEEEVRWSWEMARLAAETAP